MRYGGPPKVSRAGLLSKRKHFGKRHLSLGQTEIVPRANLTFSDSFHSNFAILSHLSLGWVGFVPGTIVLRGAPEKRARSLSEEEDPHRNNPPKTCSLEQVFLSRISAVFLTHITGKQRKIRTNLKKFARTFRCCFCLFSPCRKRSQAKGASKKVTKTVTEASAKVTERVPKAKRSDRTPFADLLLRHPDVLFSF